MTPPTFAEAFRFWLKLGFISFGGPTGQIAIMHTELVEKKKWISEERFLHALNYCMLLPGPEATQLATYIGWRLHGVPGGVVAGAFFVIPSIFILLALSWIYATHGNVPWVAAIFYGLKPAVMAIVAHAVIRIGKRALKKPALWAVAAAAFVAIFFFKVPFPVIIACAAVIGIVFAVPATPKPALETAATTTNWIPAAVCLILWWLPVVALGLWRGWDSIFVRQGVFFSKAALITFGGAYAVLPYVAQAAVEQHGWLSASQMMDGLGLAETTPGPLIMVLQFVGFMGGWNAGGTAAAVTCALLTTWVTFLPSFLFIFLGAPYVDRLYGNAKLNAVLSAVTAAVVGVVLNLAVWFGWHTVWPEVGRVDWFAVVVGIVALAGMWRWKWDVVPVVLGAGILGLIYHVIVR